MNRVIVSQNRRDILPASVDPEYATLDLTIIPSAVVGSPVTPKTTFSPVSPAVLNEIMGYISLGLGEISIDPKQIPILLYKWHTWLNRMNKWMKDNEKVYPKYLTLPQVSVPANLYFMSTIPLEGDSSSKQLTEASIAPLGPLLPTEINTMLKALQKGIRTCGDNFDRESRTKKSLSSFLLDINKIAVYAIQPQNAKLASSMTITPDADGERIILVPGQKPDPKRTSEIVLPMPPVGVTRMVQNPPQVLPVPTQKIPTLIETFEPSHGYRFARIRKNKVSNLPMWIWVAILMIILYYFVKPQYNDRFTTTMLHGGGAAPLMSISDL